MTSCGRSHKTLKSFSNNLSTFFRSPGERRWNRQQARTFHGKNTSVPRKRRRWGAISCLRSPRRPSKRRLPCRRISHCPSTFSWMFWKSLRRSSTLPSCETLCRWSCQRDFQSKLTSHSSPRCRPKSRFKILNFATTSSRVCSTSQRTIRRTRTAFPTYDTVSRSSSSFSCSAEQAAMLICVHWNEFKWFHCEEVFLCCLWRVFREKPVDVSWGNG